MILKSTWKEKIKYITNPLVSFIIFFCVFRPKPSAPPEPIKEVLKEPKKEQTKNVSFKNHLDYTSPPSSKAVPEKDQLAKLPYGCFAEVICIANINAPHSTNPKRMQIHKSQILRPDTFKWNKVDNASDSCCNYFANASS